MAKSTVYGPKENIVLYNAVLHAYGGIREAILRYEASSSATTYTLTLNGGQKLTTIKPGYKYLIEKWTYTITGTGQTSKKVTVTSNSEKNVRTGGNEYTEIKDFKWTWNKTHAQQNITITAYLNASYKITKTFTIPAKTKYTITYNANGGSGSVSSSAKWHGEAITLPAASYFTRPGYKPIKFNTNASGTGTSYNFGANYSVNANQTLYVIWQKDYTIIYNPNGGTNAPNAQVKPYNESIILSTLKPTREGYTFLGWSTSSTSTIIAYNGGETYSTNSDLNLYAIWKLEYDSRTVYELNVSGEYNASQKDIPRATQKVTGDSIEAQYEFLGWALTKPTTIIYPSNITSAEDITDIKVYTDINSSMSNTFYALYRDITPSDLTEIYHDTVIAHSNDDMAAEFQNYINTISKGDVYVDNNDESHTLFGYIQCNIDVVLNDLQGNCSNIQLDDIQILGDKIFFRITNNDITNISRHVIEITGTDSQYKSVVFNIKNKIKTPLIDIKPYSNIVWPEASEFDTTGRGVINIPSVNIKQGKLIVENPTLIDISNPNGTKYNETFITCQRTTNPNADISFGIGAGGINRGIWLDNKNGDPAADNDSGGWLIYGANATDGRTNTYIPGNLYARIPWARFTGSTEDTRRTDIYTSTDPALHLFNYWNGTRYEYDHMIGDNGCFTPDTNGFKVLKSGTYLLLLSVHYNVESTSNQGVRCQFWNHTNQSQLGSLRYDKTGSSPWGTLTNICTTWVGSNEIIAPKFGHYTGSGWFRPSVVWFMAVRLS